MLYKEREIATGQMGNLRRLQMGLADSGLWGSGAALLLWDMVQGVETAPLQKGIYVWGVKVIWVLFKIQRNSPWRSACTLVWLTWIGFGFLCSLLNYLISLNPIGGLLFSLLTFGALLLSWSFTTASPSLWHPEFKLLTTVLWITIIMKIIVNNNKYLALFYRFDIYYLIEYPQHKHIK